MCSDLSIPIEPDTDGINVIRKGSCPQMGQPKRQYPKTQCVVQSCSAVDTRQSIGLYTQVPYKDMHIDWQLRASKRFTARGVTRGSLSKSACHHLSSGLEVALKRVENYMSG